MAESFTRLLRIFRGFQRYYSQAFGPLQQRGQAEEAALFSAAMASSRSGTIRLSSSRNSRVPT